VTVSLRVGTAAVREGQGRRLGRVDFWVVVAWGPGALGPSSPLLGRGGGRRKGCQGSRASQFVARDPCKRAPSPPCTYMALDLHQHRPTLEGGQDADDRGEACSTSSHEPGYCLHRERAFYSIQRNVCARSGLHMYLPVHGTLQHIDGLHSGDENEQREK